MNAWDALADELDRWAEEGREATFWWRDDDAVTATPALGRLLEMRRQTATPLAVAVIPAHADATLAAALGREDGWTVLQHGWAHANHAPEGEDKTELGPHRAHAAIGAELATGRERLAASYGGAALPVLVPPWNRIDPALLPVLPGLGYRGVSAFGPRGTRAAAPGVTAANTHVDVIDWRGTRGFAGNDAALGATLDHLRARRLGRADATEPTGILTHHLAHDEESWSFVERFIEDTAAHRAVRWISAAEAFGRAGGWAGG